jgi:hypothetical protein
VVAIKLLPSRGKVLSSWRQFIAVPTSVGLQTACVAATVVFALSCCAALRCPIDKRAKKHRKSLQAMGMVLMFPCGQILTGKQVGITD